MPDDLRTLRVDHDERGARYKEWHKVVQESTQEAMDSIKRGREPDTGGPQRSERSDPRKSKSRSRSRSAGSTRAH